MMTLDNLAQFITIASIVVLAWSAFHYVSLKRHERKRENYERFFEVMGHIGQQGESIASKMGAAFELRKFPEYTDVICRMVKKAKYTGAASEMLKEELELTAQFLKEKSKGENNDLES